MKNGPAIVFAARLVVTVGVIPVRSQSENLTRSDAHLGSRSASATPRCRNLATTSPPVQTRSRFGSGRRATS